MKIIIAGAGDMGFHLASLLSYEQQDITLIDTDQDVLDYCEQHLDVITVKGDSASFNTLSLAEADRADLFIALATSEKTNLVTAMLAKRMGAKQTIARVSKTEYVKAEQKKVFKDLGIDTLISPRLLVVHEIVRLLQNKDVTDIFEFEEGKITVFGVFIDFNSSAVHKTIAELNALNEEQLFKPIAILRGNSTILPRPNTKIMANDHIYFMSQTSAIKEVIKTLGIKSDRRIKRIMIAGGNELGSLTASILESEFNVTIVEKNKNICKNLAENLDNCLVLHGDPSNIDLLKEEGLEDMDAFIALTPNTETNVLTSLLAKGLGVFKTIAMVENVEYTHISQNIGIDTIINKKLIAANNIFRFVRKGKIEAITGLHGVDAEVIEFVVTKANSLTTKPLRDQHLPEQSIIGGVIRGELSIIPDGDFILKVGDKVIIFAMPSAIARIEKRFR